jgi:1,4-dihydroxy-2-naphthoate octaprenyltransferase
MALRLLRSVLGAARLPFLALTPVSVALGAAASAWAGSAVSPAVLVWVLAGALAAHASVNLLNEWHDFRSGLDLCTTRTPFSGGSGALPAHPAAAPAVLAAGLGLLALAAGVGAALLVRHGWALLPLGLSGCVLVLAYTPWITRHPWACLLAPGVGFGPLVVGGTAVALTGSHVPGAYAASIVPGALVSGLLLLNQFPDVEADRRAGRRHLPLLRGRRWAAGLQAALLVAAFAALSLAVATGVVPPGTGLAWLAAPLALRVARGAWHDADDMAALPRVLAHNLALVLAMPLLMVVGGWLWPG